MHPDTLEDLDKLREVAANNPAALAAFFRVRNDLDTLIEGLDLYGTHKTGHGCGSRKYPDACNCGLDRRRERAGLSRTYPKDGPAPWAKK